MVLKNKMLQLVIGVVLGLSVMFIPRPEGSIFEIVGDPERMVFAGIQDKFKPLENPDIKAKGYLVESTGADGASYIKQVAKGLGLQKMKVEYVNGISPSAHRFGAILVFLVFMFVFEPIPLEITALMIGVLLAASGVSDLKDAWAAYMHPVVLFIMCCLIFAIALEKAGLTKRMGHFIARKAGDSPTRFTFILACGLGIASTVMHDAAATAIAIAAMLPLMRSAGIQPHTNTARFMMLAVPFACSCGGMGTLVGGGRCMVSAAFLKEFTGIEISFLDWMIFAMPAALLTVPASVAIIWLLYRPDPNIRLPRFEEELGPWTGLEKRTVIIMVLVFGSWLTKSWHGLDYSVTGPVGVAALVIAGALSWDDIHHHLEWGTALFIFGGGLSLGLAMENSGLARYFANLFFPLVKGGGWLLLFIGIGVFGALVTNVMANVAAAALILPIALPLARLEGVDPRIIALCLGMATSFAMLLVIGCPPNAIAYSYRQFKAFDLTKAGFVALPVLLGILVLAASVWWRILGLVH